MTKKTLDTKMHEIVNQYSMIFQPEMRLSDYIKTTKESDTSFAPQNWIYRAL